VDKPVDKHRFLGRTERVLWMNCGWLKNLEKRDRNPLCGPHRRRRTAFTTGDGYRPGGDLGDVGRAGKPALAAGIWDRWQVRECQAAEQSVRGSCRAGRGPSISYMEGPPPILPEGHPADRHRHAEDCGEPTPGSPGEMPSPSQIPGDPVSYTDPRSGCAGNPAGRGRLVTPLTGIGAGRYRWPLQPLASGAPGAERAGDSAQGLRGARGQPRGLPGLEAAV
jgi:hypothetical protein